jgi:leucyl aminopeptidase
MRVSAIPSLDEHSADVTVLPVSYAGELPPVTRAAGRLLGLDLGLIARRFRLDKAGDHCWVPTTDAYPGGDVLLVQVSAHPDGTVTAESLRLAATRAARNVHRLSVNCALTSVEMVGGNAAGIVTEAFVLGSYEFARYRTAASGQTVSIEELFLSGVAQSEVDAALIVAAATNLSRDWTNLPAGDLTPHDFADIARSLAEAHGLDIHVLDNAALSAGGFGGLVGVGAGSVNPPVLIELSTGEAGASGHTALVGKGITFDTGGLDLKRLDAMGTMKCDMAGAASILATMTALPQLGYSTNVRGYLACAENMPGGGAVRPGDILTHRNGTTTEVISPDAEGRLVLGDALAFAAESNPMRMIDVATLTGSTGLGIELWGVLGTDRALTADLIAAGAQCGEPGWELPLWTGYRKAIESDVADVKNLQLGVVADFGAILGALYLREFVAEIPWAHMDIGSSAFRHNADEMWAAGATGEPTRTLIRYLIDQESAAAANEYVGTR